MDRSVFEDFSSKLDNQLVGENKYNKNGQMLTKLIMLFKVYVKSIFSTHSKDKDVKHSQNDLYTNLLRYDVRVLIWLKLVLTSERHF